MQVIVIVKRGLVQDVIKSSDDIQVIVRDYDIYGDERCELDDEGQEYLFTEF